MDNSKNKENKKEESANFVNKVASIIGIVLIFLLIGLILDFFIRRHKDKKVEEIQKRKIKLEEIRTSIERLKPIRTQIDKTQKIYFLIARLIIATLLLLLNIFYLSYFDLKFTFINIDKMIGAIVNFNGAILLLYSFFAFIMYGNPSNFVKSIKTVTVRLLKKQHVLILDELVYLELEFKRIENEIKELEAIKKDNTIKNDGIPNGTF